MDDTHIFCNGHHFPLPENIGSLITKKFHMLLQKAQISPIIPYASSSASPDYLVTIEKPNRIDAMLYLTKADNKMIAVFYVCGTIYQVKFRFDASLYDETIFTGYLHENNNHKWIFYVTDILFKGNSALCQSTEFIGRLKIISDILRNQYKTDCYLSVCDLKIAGYFIYNHIPLIKKNCSIILQSNRNPSKRLRVHLSVHQKTTKANQLKYWMVTKTNIKDVYHLYETLQDAKDAKMQHMGVLTVSSNDMSKYLENLFINTNHQLLKCYFDVFFQNWVISV